jgi:ABC-type phosphate/phosphonate transport system substrate-binding protein
MPEAGRKPWAAQVPQLRIGLLGGENEADRMGRFGAYQALLQQTFDVPVRLFAASDYAGVLQAFSARQIEMSSMGPSVYAGTWIDTNGGVEPLVVPEERDGSISYISVMVTRADSGITNWSRCGASRSPGPTPTPPPATWCRASPCAAPASASRAASTSAASASPAGTSRAWSRCCSASSTP